MNEVPNGVPSGRIWWQVLNSLKNSLPRLENHWVKIISLQLLAWAMMSENGEVTKTLSIHRRKPDDSSWMASVWMEIAKTSSVHALAFTTKGLDAIDGSLLKEPVETCARLADTGMLSGFNPADAFSEVSESDSGMFWIPPELADLMTSLGQVGPETTAYLPWDGSFQLGSRVARQGAMAYIESWGDPAFPALLSLFTDGAIDVAQGDPIKQPSAVAGRKLRKFNVSVAFPPIRMRYSPDVVGHDLYNRFPHKSTSGSVLAIRHILAQTTDKVVVAVQNTFLSSPGGEKKLREELIKNRWIEAVIAMPSGILAQTNTAFAILVLNLSHENQTIKFINCENSYYSPTLGKTRAKLIEVEKAVARATGALKDDLVAELPVDVVLDNDSVLQVNRYVMPKSKRKIEQVLGASEVRSLGDVVSILRPIPTSNSDDALKVWEVGAADLPEFAYIEKPDREALVELSTVQKNEHLFLQPLDIILMIKGSVGKVGIVPEHIPPPGEGGWIVGQSGVIIRVTRSEVIHPKVLAMYLRSSIGKELLERIVVKGATVPLIQLRELQRLQVIIPSKKDGHEVSVLLDEQAAIQQEINNLRARQAYLATQFWSL